MLRLCRVARWAACLTALFDGVVRPLIDWCELLLRWSTAALAKVKELEEENLELKLSVDGLERERDFYFGKLRDIEIMCQSPEASAQPKEEFVQAVTKIL